MSGLNWRTVAQLAAAILIAGAVGMMVGQSRPITAQLGPLVVEPRCEARATAIAIATHYLRAESERTIQPRNIGNHAEDLIDEYVKELEMPRDTVTAPGDGYALAVAYQALLVRDGKLPGPDKTAEYAAQMTKRYRSEARIGRESKLDAAHGMAMSAAYQAILMRNEQSRMSPRYIAEFAANITGKFGR
jgi:hypothetical protein